MWNLDDNAKSIEFMGGRETEGIWMNKSEKSASLFLSLAVNDFFFFYEHETITIDQKLFRINATDKTDPSRGIRHLTSK